MISTEIEDKAYQANQASLTPMMRQYWDIKQQHPNTILLYRMGDFFELFDEDAVVASRLLGITLTSRNHGGTDKTPLAGFPHHAIERYLPKLISAGHRVAVCEQVEDPASAKGVVKREVVEIVTRGTALNETYLDAKANNYLGALISSAEDSGLAYLDLSTGKFVLSEGTFDQCLQEVYRLGIQELLVPENQELSKSLLELRDQERMLISRIPKGYFNLIDANLALTQQFHIQSLEAFGCGSYTIGVQAAGAALVYAKEQKKGELRHLVRLEAQRYDSQMILDAATVRNLELIKPLNAEDERGTLFHLLDKTCTAMGGRNLKHWLTHPLLDLEKINERLDAVTELLAKPELVESLRRELREINDIERLVGRIGSNRANARDLQGLGHSLRKAFNVGQALSDTESSAFSGAKASLLACGELAEFLLNHIAEHPPLTVREGGMLNQEAYPELSQILSDTREGREWLNGLQQRERERTGISTLKVGYNKVFGYYIEVSKAQQDKVPSDYMRKQSLVNGERYITPEMKEWEGKILNAEGQINALEYRLFCQLREEIGDKIGILLEYALRIAEVDTFVSLSVVALNHRYVRPVLHSGFSTDIREGRHPVVEALAEEGSFIANDTQLDTKNRQILLVTGPNMSGKSTFLRQIGLICLLGQCGSYVPAKEAQLGLVDRIFTRVGASDRLAKGQSTFMVEMIETANILHNASPRSLVLLDEIGRGTSTYDGLSLAWAIVEALHNQSEIAGRTLFATHYHELTELAERLERVENIQVTVKEAEGQVIFLRKIIEGACDSSYGIQVARMAGIPESVIQRAWSILSDLDKHRWPSDAKPESRTGTRVAESLKNYASTQQDLFSIPVTLSDPKHKAAYEALLSLDVNALPPLEISLRIAALQKKLLQN